MSLGSWIKGKLGGGKGGNGPPAEPLPTVPPAAVWRDAAANPFGVPVLDLSPVTRDMVSATLDPAQAQRAISWGESTGSDLDDTELEGLSPVACELRYPVAPILPDGLLFTPTVWRTSVLARRKDMILAARSWTGIVEANAETRLEGDILVIHALRVRETSILRTSAI
jgi:hypothetical protein